MKIYKLRAEFYLGGAMGREEVEHLFTRYFFGKKNARKVANDFTFVKYGEKVKWTGNTGQAEGPNFYIEQIEVE